MRAERQDLPKGSDRLAALMETLAQMGYATEPEHQWVNPDPDALEVAMAFPGVGDRSGEFALLHCAQDGMIYLHRLADREALELRASELPALSETIRKQQKAIADHLTENGDCGLIAFYRPPEPRDKRPQRRERRRMSKSSRRKNR